MSSRHSHARAEQVWIVERGEGASARRRRDGRACPGDIVRTPVGDIHGVEDTGRDPLVYLSITTPAEDSRGGYIVRWWGKSVRGGYRVDVAANGPLRGEQQFGRFRSEAEVNREASPAASAENDPKRTLGSALA